jgi:hypothetical protein
VKLFLFISIAILPPEQPSINSRTPTTTTTKLHLHVSEFRKLEFFVGHGFGQFIIRYGSFHAEQLSIENVLEGRDASTLLPSYCPQPPIIFSFNVSLIDFCAYAADLRCRLLTRRLHLRCMYPCRQLSSRSGSQSVPTWRSHNGLYASQSKEYLGKDEIYYNEYDRMVFNC